MIDYAPRFFRPQELLPRETFAQVGDLGLRLFPEWALRGLDALRVLHDQPIVINDWHTNGGSVQYRGWREPNCPVGAPRSRHKSGVAFDLHSADLLGLLDLIMGCAPAIGILRLEEPKITLPKGYLHIEFTGAPVVKIRVFNP